LLKNDLRQKIVTHHAQEPSTPKYAEVLRPCT